MSSDVGWHIRDNQCQNNGNVKAVSHHHCPAASTLCNCCFNCRAWAESQGQCPLHCCWGTTRSERSPNFHSPAPPPYSWSLLGELEGPAPPPSSRSFDLAWNLGIDLFEVDGWQYLMTVDYSFHRGQLLDQHNSQGCHHQVSNSFCLIWCSIWNVTQYGVGLVYYWRLSCTKYCRVMFSHYFACQPDRGRTPWWPFADSIGVEWSPRTAWGN